MPTVYASGTTCALICYCYLSLAHVGPRTTLRNDHTQEYMGIKKKNIQNTICTGRTQKMASNLLVFNLRIVMSAFQFN